MTSFELFDSNNNFPILKNECIRYQLTSLFLGKRMISLAGCLNKHYLNKVYVVFHMSWTRLGAPNSNEII